MARPDNPRLVYLDSCAFLAVINGEEDSDLIGQVLRQAADGKLEIAISALHYVEVRGHGIGQQHDEQADNRALEHLDNHLKNFVEFSRRTALLARKMAMRHGLKAYDATHLAFAIEAEADLLMTRDKGFKKLRDREIEGVWISEPYPIGEEPLPGM